MPNIGEIKANAVFQKFIWSSCEDCGKERWVLIVRGKARNKLCRSCHAKLTQPRIWAGYEKSPKILGERARHMVDSLIKKGIIEKMPCEICGTSNNLRAHHPDYNEPLRITWLCQKHHIQTHKKKLRG